METKLEQIAAKAVKQRPKSVVREIRTPRSVGTGGGRPPPVTRWAPSNGCPYRNREKKSRNLGIPWSSTDLVYGTVARISAQPSGRHAREQYRADKCPADGEGPSREALEDAQKAPDRDKGREAGDN